MRLRKGAPAAAGGVPDTLFLCTSKIGVPNKGTMNKKNVRTKQIML